MFKILNHSASYQLSYSKWSQKLKTITKLEGIANERLRILIEPLLLLLQEAMGSGQVTTVTTVVSYLWLRDLKYLLSIMSPQYDILISSIASIDYETSQLSTSIKKTLKLFQAPLFFLFVANGHPFCLFKRVARLVRGRWWWRILVIMIVLVMNEGDAGMWMMSILVIRPTLSVFSWPSSEFGGVASLVWRAIIHPSSLEWDILGGEETNKHANNWCQTIL